ncbi:MAG: NAD(P)-dependent oxidoreductase [Candidatus Helarchaeota archaeon]
MNLKGEFVLIVGGGKAGERAFRYGKKKRAKIIVIDTDPSCVIRNYIDYYLEPNNISEVSDLSTTTESILIHGGLGNSCSLLDKFEFKLIFPCVPQHLAAKLAISYLKKFGIRESPDSATLTNILKKIPKDLIFNQDKEKAIAVLSYMPKRLNCIENCTAPKKCPVTGIEKEITLFELLKKIIQGDNGIVLESKQIRPGLGAIEGKDFKKMFKFIKNKRKFIVATASRCHGIVNAFTTNKILQI